MNESYDVRGVPIIRTTSHSLPYNPLRRPKIGFRNVIRTLLLFIVFIMASYGLSEFVFNELENKKIYQTIFIFIAVFVYIYIISKRAIIWIVHVYQCLAPDAIRLRCVYEPSCSEYMIISVKKYGTIRGLWKGIKRLRRCHPPNYGIDYP